MDLLGFFGMLAFAFFVGPQLGLNQAILATARRLLAEGRAEYPNIRRLFINAAVAPTQWTLGISAVLQVTAAIAALVMISGKGLNGWIAAILVAMATSFVLHLYRFVRQAHSHSQYQMEPDPDHPGDLRVVMDNEGLPVIDYDDPNYHPGHFSLTWSLAVIILTLLGLGLLFTFAGADAGSTSVVTIGMLCVYAACVVGTAFSGLLAWVVQRGGAFIEFVTTLASRQLLVILPNITGSNVNQVVPHINLIEEDQDAARIRALFPTFAVVVTPFLVVVRTWPTLPVAIAASGLFSMLALLAWTFTRVGGGLEVENQRYKFYRVMFYAIPAFMVVRALWELTPTDGPAGHVKHWLTGLLNWGALFGTGNEVASNGPSGWSALWLLILGFGAAGLLALIATKVRGFSKVLGTIVAAAAVIMGLVGFVGVVRLISHTQGQAGVKLPNFDSYAPAAAASSAAAASVVPTTAPEPPPAPTSTVAVHRVFPKPSAVAPSAPPRRAVARSAEENRPEGIESCSPGFVKAMARMGKKSRCAMELAKAP